MHSGCFVVNTGALYGVYTCCKNVVLRGRIVDGCHVSEHSFEKINESLKDVIAFYEKGDTDWATLSGITELMPMWKEAQGEVF